MTELPDYAELPPAPHGGRSAWGLFGADDNLGLVNLMTPERVAAAGRPYDPGEPVPIGVADLELARRQAAPMNAPGGIGSPANAVAIK
jgi:hypothetical protein